jgi:hypothetical protein
VVWTVFSVIVAGFLCFRPWGGHSKETAGHDKEIRRPRPVTRLRVRPDPGLERPGPKHGPSTAPTDPLITDALIKGHAFTHP